MKLKLKNLINNPGLAFLPLLPPICLPNLHVGGTWWQQKLLALLVRSSASCELVKTINKGKMQLKRLQMYIPHG